MEGTKYVIEILSACLVPIIGLWALFYSSAQHRLEKQKFKLEMYDRRLKVFEEIKTFLSEIVRDGKINHEKCLKLMHQTNESIFLFDDEVSAYIEELYNKGLEYALVSEKLYCDDNKLPVGDERSQLSKEKSCHLRYFAEQFTVSKKLFSKFLKFKSL